jgi:hypothetical protein
MDKNYYTALFEKYPEVVTLDDFKKMLGGIADSTARKLIQENRVKHYYIRCTYYIPKVWVIAYVMSRHYATYKKKLKAKI